MRTHVFAKIFKVIQRASWYIALQHQVSLAMGYMHTNYKFSNPTSKFVLEPSCDAFHSFVKVPVTLMVLDSYEQAVFLHKCSLSSTYAASNFDMCQLTD